MSARNDGQRVPDGWLECVVCAAVGAPTSPPCEHYDPRVIAARQRVKERRQDGAMSEITPFKFEMGNWAGEGNLIAVSGTVEWGDGGWLVLSDDLRYQAPNDMSKTEAVLNWLRLRTGVDPLDNDGPDVSQVCAVCGVPLRPESGEFHLAERPVCWACFTRIDGQREGDS